MKPIVKIENLAKRFGKTYALKDVSFEVYPGEVVGFIGPNGAGKSTTIRIMLGLLKKSKGIVSLFDKDAWQDSLDIHKSVAYVPGDLTLWENLTGGQTIDLLMKLHGNGDEAKKQELVKKFNLDLSKKVKSYSKGNRQKVGLIAALAVDCDLYILDEPTSGLDPLMESIFQDEIARLKKQQKAVLLSSHILSEVERLADRVVIIQEGSVVESGTLEELRHLTRSTIHLKVTNEVTPLSSLHFIHDWSQIDQNQATFSIDHQSMDNLLQVLTEYQIQKLEILPPTLEELFMRHYQVQK
ncbi:ABC transporter ATP-binding protein [Ligilactobacillus salivarius]|uniref:ABC transporter ATP-binding protein n=1 Tax=Ligilactobacillus salivarius TaxID=1624 RepID=UPI00189AA9B6|nr:ABC transporter ATP-binding protein [Ligilactobacillus salivarius]MDE1506291.1 ABC transporter ATP-binding protein [Ligilactobacillus salivarius]MDE1521072.1 ABC transporter ATP-binding protein [Ligilactobacillus salivarius]